LAEKNNALLSFFKPLNNTIQLRIYLNKDYLLVLRV